MDNATQTHTPAQIVVSEQSLHRVNLHDLLLKQDGKFVGVEFTKQDGSQRKLNGRLGVRKHLSGGQNNVEAQDRPYVVVYDVQCGGYRAVNLATVSKVRAGNAAFNVVG